MKQHIEKNKRKIEALMKELEFGHTPNQAEGIHRQIHRLKEEIKELEARL